MGMGIMLTGIHIEEGLVIIILEYIKNFYDFFREYFLKRSNELGEESYSESYPGTTDLSCLCLKLYKSYYHCHIISWPDIYCQATTTWLF